MYHRIWQRTRVWLAIGVIAVSVVSTGCEETPRDKLGDGKRALADGDLSEARDHLEKALEADPELAEARRLMATTHMQEGDYEIAERILVDLWEDRGFGREGDLSAEERQIRQLMNEQFSELYREWARSVDRTEDPERFEEIARAGLERNSRDGPLNTMLLEFYEERADRFVERGDQVRAAKMLERIDELHRFPDTRRESKQRARQLRRDAFGDQARERFDEKLRPELVDTGAYEADTDTIVMETEQSVDRGLEPDDEEAVDQVRRTAVQTLAPRISQFALAMADLERAEVETAGLDLPPLQLREEEFRPGHYEMVLAFGRADLIELAFELEEFHRNHADEVLAEDRDDQPGPVAVGEELELDTSRLEDGD